MKQPNPKLALYTLKKFLFIFNLIMVIVLSLMSDENLIKNVSIISLIINGVLLLLMVGVESKTEEIQLWQSS